MQVHVNARHRVLVTPATDQLTNLFSAAKSFTKDDTTYSVIPHGHVETLALRALGYTVPAPIESHYDWGRFTPFKVQKETCAFLTLNKRAYVLNGLGTGKTKSALWAYDYLRKHDLAGKALVVAPLSTLMDVWGKEIFQTVPSLKFTILHGTAAKRLERLKSDADVFIINHDGIQVILSEIEELAKSGDFTHLILDELAVYRSGKSSRAKQMAKLAQSFDTVWGMTGTPTPNEPTDTWAQCMIVNPGSLPKTTDRWGRLQPIRFTKFKELTMVKNAFQPFKWDARDDALKTVFTYMQPAVRFTLDDIMELPECVTQDMKLTLGSKQKKAYEQIRKTAKAQIDSHEITAMNAAVALGKMLQISMGWTYDNDGQTATLDNHDRINALVDIIESASGKVIVYVPYKHALAGVSQALSTSKIDHAVVSGDTSFKDRTEVFRLFQNTGRYKALCAHPKCMNHGLTLTAATVTVWFGPTASAETYEQANARMARIGQDNKMLLVKLWSTPVERKMYDLLDNKIKVQSQLLAMFEDASE